MAVGTKSEIDAILRLYNRSHNFMSLKPPFSLIIIGIVLLASCRKNNQENNNQNLIDTLEQKITLSDSILVASYLNWQDKHEYIDYKKDIKVLERLELNRDTFLLSNFLELYYDSVKLYADWPYSSKEVLKYLYAIDFNGDDLLDIFYQGPTGAEPNITQIFLNQGNSYKKVFKREQNLIKMDFSNRKLSSFTIHNPGCCSDPETVEYTFNINYPENTPEFVLTNTKGYSSWTELSKNDFSEPREFQIIKDDAKLRNESYVLSIKHPVWETEGNVLGHYSKGSKGLAIGSKTENSVKWLYVLMKSLPDSTEWPLFKEQPTELLGWIQAESTNIE